MDEEIRILVEFINSRRAKRRVEQPQVKEIDGKHYIVDSSSRHQPIKGVPVFETRKEARTFILNADDAAWEEFQNLREEGDADNTRALLKLQRIYGVR
jgi:hypothetical protein